MSNPHYPDYIINPVTHRKILLGGRIWRKLVKEGLLEEETYRDPNVLYTIDEDQYQEKELKEELYKQKARLMKENIHKHKKPIVKGNKVILSSDKLTNKETAQITANSAIDIIDDIQSNELDIPTDMNRDEARQYLQGLIFDKMIAKKKKFINTKLEPKSRPALLQSKKNLTHQRGRLTLQKFDISKPPLIRHPREGRFPRPNSHLKPLKKVPRASHEKALKQVRYVEEDNIETETETEPEEEYYDSVDQDQENEYYEEEEE